MKYLIWLVVLLAVVVWFQRAKKSMLAGNDNSPEARPESGIPRPKMGAARRSAEPGAETMVQCAHCGIHFPVSEAVVHASGAMYCSEEHRRLASF
ncbi:PP0621 family protein [Herbaspirillum camelliae]|uniref:PP0621 family protein n=1 Tax=Herbaspirillum camelliae TaxID=1892903 RepID=UPI000949CD20|nr:PP0621 family protein [Herbaspirillum camelliae]